jgi:hypothetical protein
VLHYYDSIFQLQLFLSDYLDIRNSASSQQQAPSSFDLPSTDIATYFAKKRPAKPKKVFVHSFHWDIHGVFDYLHLADSQKRKCIQSIRL